LLSPWDIAGLLLWFGGSIAAKCGQGQGSWMGTKPIERIDRHKDGSVKAKGSTINGVLTGYWEWVKKKRHKNALRIF
jgi:hypothetical protein